MTDFKKMKRGDDGEIPSREESQVDVTITDADSKIDVLRLGYFYVPYDLVRNEPDAIFQILKKIEFYPVRVMPVKPTTGEHAGKEMYLYLGAANLFERLDAEVFKDDDAEVPYYDLTLEVQRVHKANKVVTH